MYASQEVIVIDGDPFSLPVDVSAIVSPAPPGLGEYSTSDAVATTASSGMHADYVIYVVPPDFRTVPIADGRRQLADTYRNALAEADKLGLTSVAFPLLSGGERRGGVRRRA